MKLSQFGLCLLLSLCSVAAYAGPAEILCNVVGGTSSDVQLDIVIDGTSGALDAFTARHLPTPPLSSTTADNHFDFPTAEIQNFWIDSGSLKLRGFTADTQTQDLLLDYDRRLEVGRISMRKPGYNLDKQIITCIFD